MINLAQLRTFCLSILILTASSKAFAHPSPACFEKSAEQLYLKALSQTGQDAGSSAERLGVIDTVFVDMSHDKFEEAIYNITSDGKPLLHDIAFNVTERGNTYVCFAYCYLKPNQLQDFECLAK